MKNQTDNNLLIESKLSVVIRYFKETNSFHTGFLYRNFENELVLYHLAWFNNLRYEILNHNFKKDKEYLWQEIPIHEFRANVLITQLEAIKEEHDFKIPYSILLNDIGIDGKIEIDKFGAGFTCATFVMQILNAQGIKIIDIQTWKYRNSDTIWQRKILEYLLKSEHISQAEFDKYQKLLGSVARYKPSEVVYASIKYKPNQPCQQKTLEPLAEELEQEIIKYCV